jgi:hypothetical protein
MRTRGSSFIPFVLLACLSEVGCAHTRDVDVSDDPKYKPWIGKTVPVVGDSLSIFEDRRGYLLFFSSDVIDGKPGIAKLPIGYPVVIEAVKLVDGGTIMGPNTYPEVILSMEHPNEKSKRILVRSGLNFVEPFRRNLRPSPERDLGKENLESVP